MPDSDEGMVEVKIVFDPNNMQRNGTIDRLPADKARQLVDEGRAVYTSTDASAGGSDAAPADASGQPVDPPPAE